MSEGAFYFVGRGPASKSLLLRALLVQSYFPHFQIKNEPVASKPRSKEQGRPFVPSDSREDVNNTCGLNFAQKLQSKEQGRPFVPADSADVYYMRQALEQWRNRHKATRPLVMDCGLSGAVLRFLALRVSREDTTCGARLGTKAQPKEQCDKLCPLRLVGGASLFKRPMRELLSILGQLSCEVEKKGLALKLQPMAKGGGWRPRGDAITLSHSRSSQFASAVLLNSWLLPFDLYLSLEGQPVSFSYLRMTIDFLKSLGMQINTISMGREYHIPKGQKLKKSIYEVEQDMGCLFALSAMTICGGEVRFTNWPEQSLQPDFLFPTLLKKMGFNVQYSHQLLNQTGVGQAESAPRTLPFEKAEPASMGATYEVFPPSKVNLNYEFSNQTNLKISKGRFIGPITYNMRDCPDLFPVLSALCVFSEGESYLYGAPHLRYKESDRLKKTAELLSKVGKTVHVKEDGLVISGPVPSKKIKAFKFDPAKDHRMAMSAGVLKKAGFPIRILNPEVVNKSFPSFWAISNIDLVN